MHGLKPHNNYSMQLISGKACSKTHSCHQLAFPGLEPIIEDQQKMRADHEIISTLSDQASIIWNFNKDVRVSSFICSYMKWIFCKQVEHPCWSQERLFVLHQSSAY